MVTEVSVNKFVELIEQDQSSSCSTCNKNNFLSWANTTKNQLDNLSEYGEFLNSDTYIKKQGYTEYHPSGTSYWSENAPFAIAYYPYHESKIYTCPDCKAVFLHYVEYAGHAPQKRLRWARKSLISFEGT